MNRGRPAVVEKLAVFRGHDVNLVKADDVVDGFGMRGGILVRFDTSTRRVKTKLL